MIRKARITVKGVVQGVYFRYTTRRKADEFGLKGWVRNLPDGRVQIVCEGDEEDIGKLIEWSGRGPEGARVEKVDVDWGEGTGEFHDFRILY
jgi:acylphosphatase